MRGVRLLGLVVAGLAAAGIIPLRAAEIGAREPEPILSRGPDPGFAGVATSSLFREVDGFALMAGSSLAFSESLPLRLAASNAFQEMDFRAVLSEVPSSGELSGEESPNPARREPGRYHTLRSTAVIAACYVASFTVMWSLSEHHTHWNKRNLPERFRDAFRKTPVWDEDHWIGNYVGHPLWGSYVYLSERNHGESRLRSFLISTVHSFAFEYFVESWVEYPSMQDLLTTSTLGSLLGEGVHRLVQRMGRDGFSRRDRILILLLNPGYRWQVGFR